MRSGGGEPARGTLAFITRQGKEPMPRTNHVMRIPLVIALLAGIQVAGGQNARCAGTVACELIHRGGRSVEATFISLHADERTAIRAFQALSKDSTRVALYTFGTGGERLASIAHRGTSYRYDPNRIFTLEGIHATLRLYNAEAPGPVVQRLTQIADSVMRRITPTRKGGFIVALHNNTEGALSVRSFVDSPDAEEVHVAADMDPDDFLYVTRRSDFVYFKARGHNVVLQHPAARDDGSLSVRCQRLGIPYINVEVQHGKQSLQEAMLLDAYQLIIGGVR